MLALTPSLCKPPVVLPAGGLTYGFSSLGDQAGSKLPLAYIGKESDPKSPYYDYVGGIFLAEVIIFVLGILATRAEPALNVMGR